MQKAKIVLVYSEGWAILRATRSRLGQTMIESTFSMIVIVMLLLSMVKVFFWVGASLSNRRAAHEQTLVSPVPPGGDMNDNYRQIRPVYYEGTPMDAATIRSDIFGSNRLD